MGELAREIIRYFFPCLINILAVIYILCKIMNRKIQFKRVITYSVIFFLNIVTIINYLYIDNFVRFFASIIAITGGIYILFKEDIHKTFVSVIFEQIIMFVSEMVLMLIFILVFGANTEQVFANQGTILANLEISAIAIGFISIKPFLKFMQRVTNFISHLDGMHKYFLIVILMVTLNVLLASVYSNAGNKSMLMINFSFIIIYSYIVYVSLSEKNQNMIFKAENKVLMDNLSEYEKMLDHQRVVNHENKNQLLAIKGMIKHQEDAVSYIDEIIAENRVDNENLYSKVKRIPSGGMQGIIYQKMIVMGDRGIKVNLDVSQNIKTLDFTKMNSKLNYDICRILGVLIDNAIEETEQLNGKQREIDISMYVEKLELVIKIANYCNQLPDLARMNERGYTTKSKGHGYGLSLVKEIIAKNDNITNSCAITEDIFTQTVKITGFE